jgi:non-specific protein-tyrosine kinase
MKLRKALDKANEERAAAKESDAGQEVSAAKTVRESALAKSTDSDKWQAPVYSTSTTVKVDPLLLAENRCACILGDAPCMDAFKVLRTHIKQRTRDMGLNTVMITSVHSGEGKTLTAINLALTFAREHQQTSLLVDCDFQKQDIYKYMGTGGTSGLVDFFLDNKPLEELIIWPGIEKFSLLSGGRVIQDSTELLGSQKMKELITEVKSRYLDRYIFLDVPAVLDGADAMAFAPLVDVIIMVVEPGRTTMPDVERALNLLPREKFLGFVMNDKNNAL